MNNRRASLVKVHSMGQHSVEIVHPKPAPVQIATVEELQPLIQWMMTKEAPVEGEEGEFDKGTVIGGDAVDLCKPWSVTRALRRFLPSFEPAQVP